MTSAERPVPDLQPSPINLDQYFEMTPEKLELIEGFLISGPQYPEERRDLLQLLLTNEGLEEAVKLAPADRWREALLRVYG